MKLNLNIPNINYVKIVYKDDEGCSHCIKASVKRIDTIDILACVKTEEKIFIKTPQPVEFSIASDNGLYKAESVLKYIEWQEPYEYFAIKIPEDIDYQQNREYFRVKLSEKASILFQTEDEKICKYDCKIHDISANGVRLEFENNVEIPEEVSLKLVFPDREINTEAKYIRSDKEDGIIKASFEFVNLSSQDLDFISQICFKIQLEAKRKSIKQ